MRIVHVTEAFGGGVTSAINTYVDHSNQFEHYLFASIRDGDVTGEENTGSFKKFKLVPRNLKSVYSFYEFIRSVQPDVIHIHSTYAGVLVRLLPFISREKIIYTPHAYAFLRDDAKWKLKVYYFIEWLLSFRTNVIAGCGRDERNIANQFKKAEFTSELINVCGTLPVLEKEGVNQPPIVVMIGRVCEQKGYRFFAEVAAKVGSDAKFLWIGGGGAEGVSVLQEAGVEVTGWISRKEVLKYLVNSDIYFHSAAWDGFPISVLEAANYELPIILREIGPFSAEGLDVVNSPPDAAMKIINFISNDLATVNECDRNSRSIREYHSSSNLSLALDELYKKIFYKEVR